MQHGGGHMLFSIQQGAKRKSGRTLLSDINWQVNEGECWLVYGLNGAGKTTLLNMINAYNFLTAGEIKLFGMVPGQRGYSAHHVREHIGYVSGLLRDRFSAGEIVRDVVLSGIFKSIGLYEQPTETQVALAREMLALLNMQAFETQYFGLLSTGEQQRVLFARALMNEPSLLILDEPANGLDFVGREQLMATLSQIRQHFPQTAVIYVSHFIEEVTEDFTHALLLKQGTIQNQGCIEAVLTNHTLSQLFDIPVALYQHHGRYQIVKV